MARTINLGTFLSGATTVAVSIDVNKLTARAEILRIRMAALRAAVPDGFPDPTANAFLEMIYALATDTIETVEFLADVTAETDTAIKGG